MRFLLRSFLCIGLLSSAARGGDFQAGLRLKKEGKFPEAAVVFEKLLADNPNDADSLEQLATIQGWQGRYSDSIGTWERALMLHPDSPDYRLGLSRVLYWNGDRGRAVRELDKLLSTHPRDVEALILEGDVFMADGRLSDARAAYARAQVLSPKDAEIARKLSGTAAPPRWRLDLGYVYDHYGNFRGYEYNAYSQIGYAFYARNNLWIRNDYLREFQSVDHMTQIGAAFVIPSCLVFMPTVGFTPKPHFRPKSQADLAFEWPIWTRVVPLFDYRYFHYDAGDVRIVTPGARWRIASWIDAEYRYSFSRNLDRTSTNFYSVRLNLFYGDTIAPYLAYAHGVEDIPPQSSAEVTYYSWGGVWNFNRRWGARFDYTYEDRPKFYQHNSIGGGVTLKF